MDSIAAELRDSFEVSEAAGLKDGDLQTKAFEVKLQRLHSASRLVDETPIKSAVASPDAKDPTKGACYKEGYMSAGPRVRTFAI